MRVTLDNIPDGVVLYNATGDDGKSIDFNHNIAGLGTVEMTLEFYVANRQVPTAPLFSVASAVAIDRPPTDGTAINVDIIHKMEDGGILIEFPATTGRQYRIQYSSDMVNWLDAFPTVIAPGTRIQWIDNGAPKTMRHPSEDPLRYYRVIELDD